MGCRWRDLARRCWTCGGTLDPVLCWAPEPHVEWLHRPLIRFLPPHEPIPAERWQMMAWFDAYAEVLRA